jgi:hypothetical protein
MAQPFPPDPNRAGGVGGQVVGELADTPVRERTPQLRRARDGRLDDERDVIIAQAVTASRPFVVTALATGMRVHSKEQHRADMPRSSAHLVLPR